MKYNELTYHKASPFYKQGYLPDRAWYNRKPKQFPSQIPTGQEYFTQVGRKHYGKSFQSQIQQNAVLTSPQKYPFQNRLAMDKSYMRSLDTTDIEGAGSGTRVNQAVRYKLRAQEELARKHNQSLNMKEHKQHEYEEKRRQLAINHYHNIRRREEKMKTNEDLENSRVNPENKERNQQYQTLQDDQRYVRNPNPDALNGNQYIELKPKAYYAGLEQFQTEQHNRQPNQVGSLQNQQHKAERQYYVPPQQYQGQHQYHHEPTPPQPQQQLAPHQPHSHQYEPTNNNNEQQPNSYILNTNDRHKSNPSYINNYEQELNRRKEDYNRTLEIDEVSKNQLKDKQGFRRNNPTNLSFHLAGQSVLGNPY